VRIADERLRAERLGRGHGSETARFPLHRAEEVLADLGIGDRIRIISKADDGRRKKPIREIPGERLT